MLLFLLVNYFVYFAFYVRSICFLCLCMVWLCVFCFNVRTCIYLHLLHIYAYGCAWLCMLAFVARNIVQTHNQLACMDIIQAYIARGLRAGDLMCVCVCMLRMYVHYLFSFSSYSSPLWYLVKNQRYGGNSHLLFWLIVENCVGILNCRLGG